MGEEQISRARRRSRAEVERIVAEFEASGLNRSEFCRQKKLSLSTLNRYRRRHQQPGETPGGKGRWVAVELSEPDQSAIHAAGSGLAVVLPGGRRIEVARRFDATTLAQLVGVLERA